MNKILDTSINISILFHFLLEFYEFLICLLLLNDFVQVGLIFVWLFEPHHIEVLAVGLAGWNEAGQF